MKWKHGCEEIKKIRSTGFSFSLLYTTNPRGPARKISAKLNKIKSGVRQDRGESCDVQKFCCEPGSFKLIGSSCVQDDGSSVLRSNYRHPNHSFSTFPRGLLGPHPYSEMQTFNGRLGAVT